MALKERPAVEPPGVPLWFLTYSDVITLLMTFFILLLTFATSEPEQFERMQATVFGGGGAGGIISKSSKGVEQDALLLRERPRASRLTTRGTETPPINSDPANASLANGLQSLHEKLQQDMQATRWIELELPALVSRDGEVTSFGKAMVNKLASHLTGNPFFLTLRVVNESDIPAAIVFGDAISKIASLPSGRIGVGIRHEKTADPTKLQLEFARIWDPDE